MGRVLRGPLGRGPRDNIGGSRGVPWGGPRGLMEESQSVPWRGFKGGTIGRSRGASSGGCPKGSHEGGGPRGLMGGPLIQGRAKIFLARP